MGKEKIINFINVNKRIILILISAILISFMLVGIIVYATTSNENYVVEIKDDGSKNIAQNGESSITKKIVEETATSLTYEVKLNNLQIKSTNPEVAILIDNSRSMSINDTNDEVKQKAIQFVTNLLNEVKGVKISIATNNEVKANLGTSTVENYTRIINGITNSIGETLDIGIDKAITTFTQGDTNEKYLVIFSDATDSVLEKLQTLTASDTNVYSILTDITNNEYTDNADTVGNVQMISDISDFAYIYNEINKSLVNAKVVDEFTEEVNNYFNFEVISKDEDVTVEKTELGYTMSCPIIKANESRTIKFKLTLKDNTQIDAGKTYRDLNTSNSTKIGYLDYKNQEQSYEMKVSPIFVICKKYSLSLEAVSEKSDKLPVTNLDVKVVGTVVTGQDENGEDIIKTIYDDTLTTDSKGKIKIDDLKTLGDITFEIKPLVDQFGYVETDATQIIVHNDPMGVGTIWAESDTSSPEVDVVERNINVKLPINVQKFELQVEVTDINNSNTKLGNIDFRLIQPKLNSKYDMEALYATTDAKGNLTFNPSIMTKDGKYEYILSQMSEQEGYDSAGNVTLYVTFENGNVTKFTHKYNDNVTTERINESQAKVTVGNAAQKDDTFKLEINVTDEENDNIKLEGAIYDVELTRVTNAGEQITTTIKGNITNAEGKIQLDLPGTGNIRLRINEVKPKAGYEENSTTKEIVLVRNEGRVQYISAKNPIDIDAIADSDANAVVVNFKSKLKTEQNRIQVHLVDNIERDINIPGAALTLTKVGEETVYNAITDVNGIANFIISDEEAGAWIYDIKLTSIPYSYTSSTLHLGTISVSFDGNKNIIDCSDVQINAPYFSPSYELMPEGEYAYHTGKVEIGLEPDGANSYNVKLKLVDQENRSIAISGAKYDITIESGEITRKITGRITDSDGMLTTRLIGENEIKITIKQTETIKGYVINPQEQIIELSKVGDEYQITHQEPYVYDTANGVYIGAELSGKTLTYHDVNKKKTGDNTILNLYINKMDVDNNLVQGVKTVLTSGTLRSSNGNKLNVVTTTDQNGYFEILGIKVNASDLKNGERVDYLDMYEIDVNGKKVNNTDIKLKLTFRYNTNKEVIEITNVEATWGNRLVTKREFSGYESQLAYESNVYLNLYTNYDDVGNFELDLRKIDKDSKVLPGAKYDVLVTRLDGTKLIRNNLEITDAVEFPGILVSEGTTIEITEKEAPIGYSVNEYTQVLKIDSVDSTTGDITVSLNGNKAKISSKEAYMLDDGKVKTRVVVDLIDYELDTFKFGITTKDINTQKPVSNYSFRVTSDKGADSKMNKTDKDGKTSKLIGARYKIEDYTVTYEINNLDVATYYKKIAPIQVKVVFDLNGNVNATKTHLANADTVGYGAIWNIAATNTVNGNDIDIQINVEPQDPLIVNVVSEDRLSKQIITTNEYVITPSLNISGETTLENGVVQAQVGYVAPGSMQTYKIKQKNQTDTHEVLEEQQFKVLYDENGDISQVLDLSSKIISESHNGKILTLKVELEPLLPVTVNITTKDSITNNVLTNVEYKITPSRNLPAIGKTPIEFGYARPNETVEYTITNTNKNEIYKYIIDECKFTSTYNNEDIITDVTSLSEKLTITSFEGREIHAEIYVDPQTPFAITNTGYFDGKPLMGSEFTIKSEEEIESSGSTDINGQVALYLDRLQADKTIRYTISQNKALIGYSAVEDFQVDVTFDSNRYIVDAKLAENSTINQYVQFVEVNHINPSSEANYAYNGNDRGIVTISVKNYPAMQINMQNVDRRDGVSALIGATYKIKSSKGEETVATIDSETTIAYVGRVGFSTTLTYEIEELSPSQRYQSECINTVIEVDFDENGFVIETRVIKREDIVTVSLIEGNNFGINLKTESNPELKININKVDKDDSQIKIPNIDFEITAKIKQENLSNYTEEEINKLTLNTQTLSEEQYLSEVLDRLKINREDVEIIRQTIAIENLINELKSANNLTDEEENEIKTAINNNAKINKIIDLNKANKTQINNKINSITNENVIDKLISNNTITRDAVNDTLEKIKALIRLDVDNVTTDINGQAVSYMDKTLANKTIEYTIKETKKADGYDWLDEIVILEISYDSEGKMITDNPVKVVSGNIDITNIDINNFTIDTTIKNKISDEVRIHLTVEDVYDSSRKLETAKFDTYLVDTNGGLSFAPDNAYRINLESGSSIVNGVVAHGEDDSTMGIYEGPAGNRILRLVQKQTPNTYYIGNDKYSQAYQSIAYAILINVGFNDEGDITEVSLYKPGENSNIGYVVDERYIQVSNSRNTINITLRYYPMLQLQMQTADMYTEESLKASYNITTYPYDTGGTHEVKSGYIGAFNGTSYRSSYTTSEDIKALGEANIITLAPTEAELTDTHEREFYIYEYSEPTSPIQYQKYRARYIVTSSQRMIGKIKVIYDEIGRVKDVKVIQFNSYNSIKSGYIEANIAPDSEYTIQVKVKYAPMTTITATVIDEISGKGLSGIEINPYIGGKTSYEYRTTLYYTTGSAGTAGWTYWGANEAGSKARYELNTYTNGSGYNGYFDPGNIILDVTYDEYGRVFSVTPRSTDAYGDINAIDITWENNNIKVKIPYSRKFNTRIDKVDYNDSNIVLNAMFKVLSSEGANVNAPANTTVTIGKVYAGKTVKYTLSEPTSPVGYLPISNLEYYVTFNNDGSVRSTSSESSYYEFVKSESVDKNVNRVNKTDLEVRIKNKERFDLKIDLSDAFYPSLKLEGALFSIENSKGDIAMGSNPTDSNGILETYVGPVYPNEEVTYTIKQTNTLNNYNANNYTIQVKVKFNESGRIETYSLISGNEVATMDINKFVNKREIELKMTNKPKDIKIGIYKYDSLTNSAMDAVKFNVKVQVINENTSNYSLITNPNGTVVDIVDNFQERNSYRVVEYTISEIESESTNTYRKIQDVVIEVTYNPDGSIYMWNEKSNPSNVKIEIATGKNIKYINNTPVHIKLSVPNDNAYDLIIKNEDTNYAGLGIEGTTYDVSINGVAKTPLTTNKDGIAKLANQTQSGNITLRISEKSIGEGYRSDNNNDTTIEIYKGEETYSLTLNSNSNPTYADVQVDEVHGTITVTFKNETKLELNLAKDDMDTKAPIGGIEFEIIEEELNNNGEVIEGTQKTITTDENNTTNANGLIYFDLGLSKQNKIIRYTVTEKTKLEGYFEISPIKVKVTFDMYGRITSITDDSYYANVYLSSSTGKSHNMMINVLNKKIPETGGDGKLPYSIKIISQDSQTNTRINGSIFQVEVFDESEQAYKSETGVSRDETKKIAGRTYVTEKGVMRVNSITAPGNVKIALNQTETAIGYEYGLNKVTGNIIINATYTAVEGKIIKDLSLSIVDDGQFDVSIDDVNKEIIIKIKNDPQLTFNITKIDANTKQKLEGAKFNVTSVIQTSTTTVPTDLNETARQTDENGYTTLNGGIINAGKNVIYTISEEKLSGYKKLDDIVVLVRYDTKGNILYYEILSDLDNAKIEDGEINIQKRIINDVENLPGIVEVNYDSIEIPTGVGSRILELEVSNTREIESTDYQIVIEKHHELDGKYPYLIPGVTFQITVTQEYGKKMTSWVDMTNEDGTITSPYFSGYGNITVEIKELATVDGFEPDYTVKTLRFTRDKITHKLQLIALDGENIGYEFSEDNSKVILKPVNELEANIYNLVINKVDKKENTLIANNPATIEVYRVQTLKNLIPVENEETGEITYNEEVSEIKELIVSNTTDRNGRIVENKLTMPEEEGTYTYIIKETKAPDGYAIPSQEAKVNITFARNEDNGELFIASSEVISGDNVSIASTSKQLINLIIQNDKIEDVVQEGEYLLDITKTDIDRNAITTDTAIFKLTDTKTGVETYIQTDEYGNLNIPKFNIPNEECTYTYKLNELKSPNGYILNGNDINIELEFKKNDKNQIYLNKVTVDGENVVYEQPEEGKLPSTIISIDVMNEEGENAAGNTNEKQYELILNKVDSNTKESITEAVKFDITLVNGETVNAATSNGRIEIKNVFMPARPGEYEIIMQEMTTPEGYIQDKEMKIMKVKFEGTGKNMKIADIQLDDSHKENIEIVSYEEGKIEINILNVKANPELYVVSKENSQGNDIYDVLKRFDGRHYTLDNPFIDTKVAKYGSNITVQEFIDNLESNGVMTVLDKDGNVIKPTDRVKTGMTLRATKDDQELTFTIIVKGDCDGDGRVRTKDLDKLIKHMSGESKITDPIELRALDLKENGGDGKIRTTDLNEFYNVMAQY